MKNLRILHISETFTAGVYTYIKDICRFFDEIPTFENHVIYSGERKDTAPEKFDVDFSENTILYEIPMTREISPIKDIRGIVQLMRQIKKIKPDIIHLHSSKAGVLGRIAALFSSKAKLFYTPNGYSFLREDVSDRKKKIYFFIEKYVQKIFGGVTIACGDTEYKHAKKLGPAVLVRNGVTIEEVTQIRKNTTSKKLFTIGSLGRLSPQKNPELFNLIASEFKDLHFIWVGDGELRNSLKQSNIQITGWMPREAALAIINDFDIYIQTSLWEGLPFTIIEAMLLGKPIVATNVPGNKDAVEHDYNGFLCENIKDFSEAIKALVENRELLEYYGQNSSIRAKKLFDKDKNFEKLLMIYTAQ